MLALCWMFSHAAAPLGLSHERNSFREGDSLAKAEIPYAPPGERGGNAVWRIDKLDIQRLRPQMFWALSDTVVSFDSKTMYYCSQTEKAQAIKGYESRTTRFSFSKPMLSAVWPMAYGDSVADSFRGAGSYCGLLYAEAAGTCSVTADGWGALIIGGDTVRNVLRVHRRVDKRYRWAKEPFQTPEDGNPDAEADSLDCLATEDCYAWYAEGCRYPVLETLEITDANAESRRSTICLPLWQLEDLADDPANREIREANDDLLAEGASDNTASGAGDSALPVRGSATLDGTRLAVEYEQDWAGTVTVIAADITGISLAYGAYDSSAGAHSASLTLSRAPAGGVLLVHLWLDSYETILKINI